MTEESEKQLVRADLVRSVELLGSAILTEQFGINQVLARLERFHSLLEEVNARHPDIELPEPAHKIYHEIVLPMMLSYAEIQQGYLRLNTIFQDRSQEPPQATDDG